MANEQLRGVAGNGTLRFLWVEVADLVQRCIDAHGLERASAPLLGDLIVATTVQQAWIKDDARMTVMVQGDAPNFTFHGEVDGEGDVVARLAPGNVVPSHGLFSGQLVLIRHLGAQQVYRGQSLVVDDNVELSLERHHRSSDQVDVAVRMGVGEVGACGLLLERLPVEADRSSMDADAWRALRLRLADMDMDEVRAGLLAGELLGLDVEIMTRHTLRWQCRCSDDKVRDMLLGLGRETLTQLADEDHGAEVSCNFCGQRRVWDEGDLRVLAGIAGVVAEA